MKPICPECSNSKVWLLKDGRFRCSKCKKTFSCDVNGSTGTISNFSMSGSGGSKSASINGASKTLNSSSFDISDGTWNRNGTTLNSIFDYMSAHGSLYGPNGEHIGGPWGMKTDYGDGAEGISQDNKQ